MYHRKNEIAINCGNIQDPAAITINYRGKMVAESMLPNDWMFRVNSSKIMLISLGESIPELLMNYKGAIKILGATIVTRSLESYSLRVEIEDIDYWNNITSEFDTTNAYWGAFNSYHERIPDLAYTSMIQNNLLASPGEFFFRDGKPYNGDYHMHGDFQSMTGAEHSEESEFIYRKDENNRIVDFREKKSKGRVKQILRKHGIGIPKTRIATESDSEKIKKAQKIVHGELTKEEIEEVYVEANRRKQGQQLPSGGLPAGAGGGGAGGEYGE